MGAYTFMYFNFRTTLRQFNDQREVIYLGRPASASPATGSNKQKGKELLKITNEAMTIQ